MKVVVEVHALEEEVAATNHEKQGPVGAMVSSLVLGVAAPVDGLSLCLARYMVATRNQRSIRVRTRTSQIEKAEANEIIYRIQRRQKRIAVWFG